MKKFLKEYRVEAIAVLLALVGVFLLIEQFEIRATLRAFLTNSSGWLANLARSSIEGFSRYFQSFTLSDLVGWVLVLTTTIFVALRFRYHYLRSERWNLEVCPRCGSSLHRIRRTRMDHLLSKIFLPHAGRYLCSNSKCRWNGLLHRIDQQEHKHRHSDSKSESDTTGVIT